MRGWRRAVPGSAPRLRRPLPRRPDRNGRRLEWNGALKVSGVSFEPRAQRDARLEASRARQRAEAPAPAPAPSAAPVETARAVAPPAPARTTEHVPPAYWTDFRGPNRAGVY